MATFLRLVMIAIAAALTENIIFSRGICYDMRTCSNTSMGGLLESGVVTSVISVVAAISAWCGGYLADNVWELIAWTRPVLMIALYCAIIMQLMMLYNTLIAKKYKHFRKLTCGEAFGFLPIAVVLLTANQAFTFLEAVVYGLFSGVGFFAVMVVNLTLQKRLSNSDVPVAFRGAPITILSLGILSLAFFGLLGHTLA